MVWEIWDGLLQRDFTVSHSQEWNRLEEIQAIQIGSVAVCVRPNTVYLYTDLQNAGNTHHHSLYIVTQEELSQAAVIPEYYIVAEKDKKEETVNQILRLFMEGQQWLSRIREAARADHDMQTLVELVGHFWKISVFLVNAAYEIGEHVDMPGQIFAWDIACDENGRMTEEAIADLYLDTPQFDLTFTTHGLQKYMVRDRDTDERHVSYYYNFMDESDTYMGRILFATFDKTVSPEIQAVFSYVAQQAEICFQAARKNTMATKFQRELRQLFLQMLENENVRQAAVNVVLEQKGWKITDDYTVYRLLSNGNMHSHHTLTYYCHMLERMFPELLAVEKDNGIYCLSHCADGQDSFREQLPYFLREHLFLAGVSNIFRDFFSINLYAREAACALEFGMRYNTHLWVHEFSGYALLYSIEKITEDYPAGELVHPGLKMLEAYDREHPGSDLSLTLEAYLRQQFNATHTANELHIHRTTLLYRLRRIHELTGVQLEDRDTVLHLLLSYALLSAT